MTGASVTINGDVFVVARFVREPLSRRGLGDSRRMGALLVRSSSITVGKRLYDVAGTRLWHGCQVFRDISVQQFGSPPVHILPCCPSPAPYNRSTWFHDEPAR